MFQYLVPFLLLAVPTLALPAPGACTTLPENIDFTTNPALPNPFAFLDGTPVVTPEQWACRREEIGQLFQRFELGTLPPRPEQVSGSFSNGVLTVNATEAGKSISFTVPITPPKNLTLAGKGPFPAVIAVGGASVPIPSDVALINFNNNDIALQNDQSSRGVGKFFTLYGSNHSAGALIAWTWGIGRIIDVLETTPGHNIDVKRLGVTGCSRNGKGAYVAGAFEERIALTLVQESGSGGAGCWRISDDMLNKQNITTQTASEIVQENVWFSPNFNPFVNEVTVLPFDHHMLAGLVAPRGLLVIDNTGIDWLGPESVWGCQTTGHLIYEALGIPSSMGITQEGNHDHCALPADEAPDVSAFISRFLKGQNVNTTVFDTDGPNNVGFVPSTYINWNVPKLH
ncbi:4-O-methyl-glucuronoyl methylesterase [Psilocybe cubensis]|uniref:(4-O-methyl)-D-glucuronate--lignin esterase n=2 Tax=Psilocybe cubensis TaxID=181762 RepID=A0A8H7XYI2_PSICU|nr:4-O-methyl-glucuronoyl methylesterase [Psilocybe cubensis]KAH9478145.1 4-O-methyl-glucuronoyl methylesterase [Psilocybe cubensis]